MYKCAGKMNTHKESLCTQTTTPTTTRTVCSATPTLLCALLSSVHSHGRLPTQGQLDLL